MTYDPIYTSSQIAAAAGITHVGFRAYLARGQWRVIGAPAEKSGKSHRFSIRDAVGYALAYRLVQSGVDPATAFERAMIDFAHAGDGGRNPGDLFDFATHGMTIYAYWPDAAIGQCLPAKQIVDPLLLFFPPMHQREERAILVNMNDLWRRVTTALNWQEG